MKKQISIPAPIKLYDKVTKTEHDVVAFPDFCRVLLGAQAFKGVAGARLAHGIDVALDYPNADGRIYLSAEQYAKLKEALDGDMPFPPRTLAQLLPFVDAIVGASDYHEPAQG